MNPILTKNRFNKHIQILYHVFWKTGHTDEAEEYQEKWGLHGILDLQCVQGHEEAIVPRINRVIEHQEFQQGSAGDLEADDEIFSHCSCYE